MDHFLARSSCLLREHPGNLNPRIQQEVRGGGEVGWGGVGFLVLFLHNLARLWRCES